MPPTKVSQFPVVGGTEPISAGRALPTLVTIPPWPGKAGLGREGETTGQSNSNDQQPMDITLKISEDGRVVEESKNKGRSI